MKNAIWKVLNALRLAGPLQIIWTGKYLEKIGWLESFYQQESIDVHGNPLPWCTYPFIQFIEPRINKSMDVFEYGAGNSTVWYAQRVNSVTSVDHDQTWVNKLLHRLPENASIVFKEINVNDQYCNEIASKNIKYHIIVIDGRERNKCTQKAIDYLTDDGVIVFDNSQLSEYSFSIKFLLEKGFRRIDFYGLLPIVPHENCTTIFYKSNNCLMI